MPDNKVKTRRRELLKSTGAGLVGTSFAGCLGGGDGNGDTPTETPTGTTGGNQSLSDIKIGVLLPFSGPYSSVGERTIKGVNLANAEIQNSGNILPDTSVEIVQKDTQIDPEVGLEAARELVLQDEVDIMMGAVSSAVTGAALQVSNQEGVPLVMQVAADPPLTEENCSWTGIRVAPQGPWLQKAVAEFMVREYGADVYMTFVDYSAGYTMRDSVTSVVDENNGNIVGTAALPPGHDEWESVISEMKTEKPDWVFLGHPGTGGLAFLQQAVENDFQIPIGAYVLTSELSGALQPNIIDNLPPVFWGVFYERSIDNSENAAFKEAFQGEYESPPTHGEGLGYLTMKLMLENFHRAGSKEPQDVVRQFEGSTFNSIVGDISIRACDHTALRPIHVAELVGLDETHNLGVNDIISEFSAEDLIHPCTESKCDMNRPWE